MIATIAGALLGGALTTRWGIFRALWLLGAVQALSNLAYYAAAAGGATKPLMYTAAVVEQFTQGLGTAAFLAFLMALCDRRFARRSTRCSAPGRPRPHDRMDRGRC